MSSMSDRERERYRSAVEDEGRRVDEGLAAIRQREMSGELSVREGANARIDLMTSHLATLTELRSTYLGGESGA